MSRAEAPPPGVVLPADQPALVTPEAVVLELQVANLGWRILAYLLDVLLLSVVIGVVVGVPVSLLDHFAPDDALAWVLALIGVAALIPPAYFVATETLMHGRTIGKLTTGLRVVTKEGGQIRFRHALVRALLGLVDFGLSTMISAPGLVAVITIASTANRQRVGDLAAGTLVVRERRGPPPAPVYFRPPPGLEGYVAVLDTNWLSDAEYHVLRAHLVRGARPPERTVELAAWLFNRVSPPPPHGTPPDVFLVAVAAARQRRAAGGARQPQPVPQAPPALVAAPRPAPPRGVDGFAPPS
jgi:uncharacterized RDD family membrane protein YckC